MFSLQSWWKSHPNSQPEGTVGPIKWTLTQQNLLKVHLFKDNKGKHDTVYLIRVSIIRLYSIGQDFPNGAFWLLFVIREGESPQIFMTLQVLCSYLLV